MRTERECSVNELIPQLRDAVKSLLPSDEQVLVCYEIIDKPGGGEKLFNFLASSNCIAQNEMRQNAI